MLFFPLGTMKSTTNCSEKLVNLWGIELESQVVLLARVPSNMALGIKLRKVYALFGRPIGYGFPEVYVQNYKLVEEKEITDIASMLDFAASNPYAERLEDFAGKIIKVDDVIEVVLGNDIAEVIGTITGISNQVFSIAVHDLRWAEYWKTQKQYANAVEIKDYLNQKNVYMFFDFEQKEFGGKISCSALVVL